MILEYFLELGYKTIHIAGIDFYQGKFVYLNTKNDKMTDLSFRVMKGNHLGLGAYDIQCHSLEFDIN